MYNYKKHYNDKIINLELMLSNYFGIWINFFKKF